MTLDPLTAAGAVLCRAFVSDPAFVWALPKLEARRSLTKWFGRMTAWAQRFGEARWLGPAEAPTAVALWGKGPVDTIEHLRSGMLGPTLALGPGAVYRFMRLGAALGAWHERLCPEPHRYLAFIGVDPSQQHRGLGSELIKKTLREADEAGVPCYLETTTEANVSFYRRLDFSVAHEGEVLPHAPRFWLLKRPPRST